MSQDIHYKNQIDCILGRRGWRSTFQSVKTSLDADCGSSQELLTATVRIKLQDTQLVKKGWKLDIDNIPEDYKNEMKQKQATVNLQGRNSEEIWKALKDTFKDVVDKTIPRKEKKNGPIWMSQDTLQVMNNRRKRKMEGNWVEVRKLNGDIQKRIRKDKENYLKEKCRVLEEYDKKGRTRELHQQIREITGKPKINTGTLKSRARIDYAEKDRIIRKWKEYTEDLYKQDPNTSIDCQEKAYTWFVPKVSVLIFLCTNWQRSTSMYIGMLVVTLTACPYLFQLDWLSQSCATAVCVWSCFLTSLHLRCRRISNNGTPSNFV